MKKHFLFGGILLLFLGVTLSCSNSDSEDDVPSNIRSIVRFAINPAPNAGNVNVQHLAVIDESNKTITLTLPAHIDLTSIRPEVIIGPFATVTPQNLEAVDFSADLIEYTVTAQSGKQAVYSIIKDMSYVYKNAQIYAVSFPAVIDPDTGEPVVTYVEGTGKNITVIVPKGTNVTSLTPVIELSPESYNATFAEPWDVPHDFTNPVTFSITPESGGTPVVYTITVKEKEDE